MLCELEFAVYYNFRFCLVIKEYVFFFFFLLYRNNLVIAAVLNWLVIYSWYWRFSLFIVFNATFTNISVISWRSVLLVDETGVPRENHRPVPSYWQTLSHNVVSSTPRHERGSNSQLKSWYWRTKEQTHRYHQWIKLHTVITVVKELRPELICHLPVQVN